MAIFRAHAGDRHRHGARHAAARCGVDVRARGFVLRRAGRRRGVVLGVALAKASPPSASSCRPPGSRALHGPDLRRPRRAGARRSSSPSSPPPSPRSIRPGARRLTSSRRCGMCSSFSWGARNGPTPPTLGAPAKRAPLDPPRWRSGSGAPTLVLGLASSASADQARTSSPRPTVSPAGRQLRVEDQHHEQERRRRVGGRLRGVRQGRRGCSSGSWRRRAVSPLAARARRDLWIYLRTPANRAHPPVAAAGRPGRQRDIARADYAGDYDATLTGEDALDGVAATFSIQGEDQGCHYSAIKYWVSKEGRRPVKAEFYAARAPCSRQASSTTSRTSAPPAGHAADATTRSERTSAPSSTTASERPRAARQVLRQELYEDARLRCVASWPRRSSCSASPHRRAPTRGSRPSG